MLEVEREFLVSGPKVELSASPEGSTLPVASPTPAFVPTALDSITATVPEPEPTLVIEPVAEPVINETTVAPAPTLVMEPVAEPVTEGD